MIIYDDMLISKKSDQIISFTRKYDMGVPGSDISGVIDIYVPPFWQLFEFEKS